MRDKGRGGGSSERGGECGRGGVGEEERSGGEGVGGGSHKVRDQCGVHVRRAGDVQEGGRGGQR